MPASRAHLHRRGARPRGCGPERPGALSSRPSARGTGGPQLQRILNQALHSGGWFGEAHEEQVRRPAAPGRAESAPLPADAAGRGDAHGDARGRGGGVGAGSELEQPGADDLAAPLELQGYPRAAKRPRTGGDHPCPTSSSGQRIDRPGYLAAPDAGRGPAVVVLQEWWGLDDHIRGVCDRPGERGLLRAGARPLPGRDDRPAR